MHGSGSSDKGVPDYQVTMKSCSINDWFFFKDNYRDFGIGKIELMKPFNGVIRKTILKTDHSERIYLLIKLRFLYYYLNPNVQCRSLLQLLKWLSELGQLVIYYLCYYKYSFSTLIIFKHFIPPLYGCTVAGPVQSSDSPLVSEHWLDATVGIYVLLSHCRAEIFMPLYNAVTYYVGCSP